MKTTTPTHPVALRLLAALFFLCLLAPMAAGQDASTTPDNWQAHVAEKIKNEGGGGGTDKDNPILIATPEELAYFAQQVNAGEAITYGSGDDQIEPIGKDAAGGFDGYYFALSADIALSAYYWTPIGTYDNPFKGNFDGKGHCVSGLKVDVNGNRYADVYAGLFGNAAFSTLQNLGVRVAKEGVRGAVNQGAIYAGGIAGSAQNVHNCYVVGEGSIEITGEGYGNAGGIVGSLLSNGSLTNCYATVDIMIETDGERYAGGIVGHCNFNSTISCTYATGDVEAGTGDMLFYAGGICGYLGYSSKIENNLALNGQITGGNNFSNRIVGEEEDDVTLTANYASPKIVVNGNPVSDGAKGDANGDPSITFNNLQKTLEDKWQAAWTFPDGGYLPQLMLKDGEGNYTNWPKASPQPFIDPVASLPGSIANAGDGSNGNPILIANRAELAYFAKQVNKGEPIKYGNGNDQIKPEGQNAAGGFSGYYFALSADIDLKDHYWTPIGTGSNSFKGNFDGQGHCVSGLKVDLNGNDYVYAGLFGNADVATIQNLGVRLAEAGIRAHATNAIPYAGGIAGKAKNIHNCYVEGPGTVEAYATSNSLGITPSSFAGGIVGSFLSSLTHCYAMVDVKAEGGVFNYAGGIAGSIRHSASLSYTYATGAVEAAGNTANNYAGGICGFAYTGSSLLNNLALNKSIKDKEGESNRIVGNKESNVTLASNYASPEIQVNGKFVDAGDDMNGDPEVNLGNLGDVFTGGNGWTFPTGCLPQLKIWKDDTPTYDDWPTSEGFTPQPSLDATRYLIADGFAGGKGASDNPYQITNRAELAYLAKQVNSGTNYSSKYFALANDIDMNVSPFFWTPIGIGFNQNFFKGHFDGRGYCVKGLKVSGVQYAGLFGIIQDGTVQNLGVEVAAEGITAIETGKSGNVRAGGIAGELDFGTIRNCYVTGDGMVLTSADGLNSAGGIVGFPKNSKITHCYATINVKATVKDGDAGGIAGLVSRSTISYTYSTGAIETTNRAGGICGYAYGGSSLSNNLALNSSITGNGGNCHRVVGNLESSTATNNYASTKTTCSFTPVDDLNGLDGANTYLNSFVADLKNASGGDGWDEGWEDFSAGTNLPQLKMYKQDDTGYETWNSTSNQPSLKAENYLLAFPKLHIVSPTGGTLTVTDKDGNELPDGSEIPPGTLLTLAYTERANYRFSEYLFSNSSADDLVSLSDNPVTMPATNLWLSASFDYQEPPPPPPAPVYYSVYLPQVEGASTDPGPGEYEVESGDDFRFYLTLDSAYSESQPIVTTDRGETLVPRSSDGAYLINDVCSDVEVFIDGLIQNPPPVANEAISTDALVPQIWAEGSMLCIRMPEALPSKPVSIYTTDGRLHNSFDSTPGLNRRQLPTGMYIVRVGETVRKVVIRK